VVPVVNCNRGEILRVPPGEVVPADGTLIENASALDESLLTGESKPVEKILVILFMRELTIFLTHSL